MPARAYGILSTAQGRMFDELCSEFISFLFFGTPGGVNKSCADPYSSAVAIRVRTGRKYGCVLHPAGISVNISRRIVM